MIRSGPRPTTCMSQARRSLPWRFGRRSDEEAAAGPRPGLSACPVACPIGRVTSGESRSLTDTPHSLITCGEPGQVDTSTIFASWCPCMFRTGLGRLGQ